MSKPVRHRCVGAAADAVREVELAAEVIFSAKMIGTAAPRVGSVDRLLVGERDGTGQGHELR